MREDDFSDELNRTIAKWLIGGKSPSAILDELDADQRDRAAGIFQQAVPISPELAGQMAADCVEKDPRKTTRRTDRRDQIAPWRSQGEARGELLADLTQAHPRKDYDQVWPKGVD